jgi:hypothetical protein
MELSHYIDRKKDQNKNHKQLERTGMLKICSSFVNPFNRFNMGRPEMTDEIKNDLKALKLRNFIFQKRFYKNNDTDKFPKYF